ncbi:MAG TPA: glycine oxidase ThiO [Micromonosporaceae bacterium]|nr:glycine oxidase ThiO [Micromonosporaceae bacterium]
MRDAAGSSVVIAGGGVIGLAVAWRAAVAGLRVSVVDDAPGTGASYAAAGMLAPVAEAAYGEEGLLQMARASLDRYPSFVTELERASGIRVGLRTVGTLVVGFDEDDLRVITELAAYQRELGLDPRRLTPRECRRLEPAVTPRLRGGLHIAGDHSVDARALHAALLLAAARAGAGLVRERVAEVVLADGRAVGVRLGCGRVVPADTVVVALGAWSGDLPGVPREVVPVRPVKGQILRLRGEPLISGTVRALVRGRPVYLVPYGADRITVGATMEEMGFDPRVTVGAVRDLLADATEVVPGLTELELVETLARWRPGTPDNAPLIGPTGVPGLVLATGHHRNGVLLAPVTGDAIAGLLTTGVLPPAAAACAPTRFATEGSP